MAQQDNRKPDNRQTPVDDIVERGSIYFLYRPKVERDDVTGLNDVQRFEMVLKPDGRSIFRLVVIGSKSLPRANEHERNWAFVEAVTSSAKALEEGMRESTYETKTRGERTVPAVRPAGEGRYVLFYHDDALHVMYALEVPREPGPVQRALNIAPEAAWVVSLKNPEAPAPEGAGLAEDQQANYPKAIQQEFRDRTFADEDPKMLDYEGAELILVGATLDPEETYDADTGARDRKDGSTRARALKTLRMAKSRHPVEPLFKGEWA